MALHKRLILCGTFGLCFMLWAAESRAGEWVCPDSGNDLHHREVLATSAPEAKVRSAVQDEAAAWAKTVKPLTAKAVKLAKEERSKAIEDGIEHSCSAPQTYVAQLVNAPETASGCEHKIVTRPADAEHLWAQVVATCKYDWSCCSPKGSGRAGFSIEGPVGGTPPATESTATTKSNKR